jgi:hypothetical protein
LGVKEEEIVASFSRDATILVNPGVVHCEMGGGVALLDLATANYFSLNAVGAEIWAALSKPISVAEIEKTILSRYDVTPERARNDVAHILSEMKDARLISVD